MEKRQSFCVAILVFLACKVPEGDHTVLLTFRAPGLREGAVGSILCWILFAGSRILILYKKEKSAVACQRIPLIFLLVFRGHCFIKIQVLMISQF